MNDASEIVAKVADFIQGWSRLGGPPNFDQESYKSNLFDLCSQAFLFNYHSSTSRPRLTGDALRDAVRARWPEDQDPRILAALDTVCEMWRQWLYALERCPLRHTAD